MTREPARAIDVSVLVLAYNHEPYIAECLDSILAQDFDGAVEVLVGEDCSPDGTRAVVERYVQRFPDVIRLVTSEHNVGMHANFDRLLARSAGRYIALCEGDDNWHAMDKLRVQIAELEKHPDWAGVHSDVDHLVLHRGTWLRCGSFWSRTMPDRGAVTQHADLLVRNLVQTCSVLLRGEATRAYRSTEAASAGYAVGDWPLFLHVTRHGPLGVMTRSLATYRSISGSMTNRGAASNEKRIADQFRLIKDAARGRPELVEPARRGLRTTRFALLFNAVEAGDRDLVLRALDASSAEDLPEDGLTRAVRVVARVPGALGALSGVVAALRVLRRLRRYS